MFFTQLEFLFFILALLVLLNFCRGNTIFKAVLLAASVIFYGYWDVRFLLLLFACIVVNYFCAERISREPDHAKRYLYISIVFNVGLLGIFKYYNFFAENLGILLACLGVRIRLLNWILPLGISFFTFQNISYVVDVYQRKTPLCKSFFDFSLFILYFPKLMVGPIVRASDFMPQLQQHPQRDFMRFYSGVRQFAFGLFEKLILADYLALFVDKVFDNYQVYSGGTLFLALSAYTLQIYCDFCGYSDMAIGSSRAIGYELCENFDLPYLAENVTDFWRRWHISLSTWLRDYIYIPLGGNRHGFGRSCFNSFITMLIGGLWHGANWTFIIWGGWHGIALAVHRLWKKHVDEKWHMPRILALVLTLAAVMLGWLFFRSTSIIQALVMLKRMVFCSTGICWIEPVSMTICVTAVAAHIAAHFGWHKIWRECKPGFWGFTVLWLLFLTVLVFRPTGFHPFVYNQF